MKSRAADSGQAVVGMLDDLHVVNETCLARGAQREQEAIGLINSGCGGQCAKIGNRTTVDAL
jgi:hypothetical protein